LNFNPPWTGVGQLIESATRKALFDFQMIEHNKLAVALSGGKDSITLLLMLKAISGRGFPPFELHAIHVSGEFSCGAGIDTEFLSKICQSLDVPLHIQHSTQKKETLACYRCSRERRSLIFNAAKEAGIFHIAFGHHRDDSAQTLLMNLLHKAEFAGNLPKLKMIDYGVTILRPLIFVSEESIKAFAKQQGFARIVCRCPVGQNSYRRKTDELLSQIETLYPNARANLAKAALMFGSDKAKKP
jgi:tRNA(Ile)-lysidine synthase TilS/MesJ